MEKKDFFISYAGENEDWALWVAETLARHDYTVCLQAWDIVPGDNFINSMDDFLEKSDNFIAIWSRDYSNSTYCKTEWTSAFHEYKAGTMKKFLPLRVERCNLPSVLGGIVHDNLYECDELLAEKKLLRAVGYTGIIRKKGIFPKDFPSEESAPLPVKEEPRRQKSQIKEPVFDDDDFDRKKKIIVALIAICLVVLTLTAGGISYLIQYIKGSHIAQPLVNYESADYLTSSDREEDKQVATDSQVEIQLLDVFPGSSDRSDDKEGNDAVDNDVEKTNSAATNENSSEDLDKGIQISSGFRNVVDSMRELFQKGTLTSQDFSIKLTELAQSIFSEGKREDAKALLEEAIEKDSSNADAYNALGDYYYDRKAWEDALSCFLEAAKLNDAVGYSNVGVCYFYSDHAPVEKNYALAKEYFEKAAQLDDIRSLWYLGEIYFNGDKYVSRDYEMAYQYYKRGADKGYPAAIRDLGYLYEHGLGIPQDYDTARQCYEEAAELKDDKALSNLANLYMNGIGVTTDYTKARICYEQAADLGNARAYFNLGNIYEKGLGVEADMGKAIDFYKIARSMNNKSAKDRLDALNVS